MPWNRRVCTAWGFVNCLSGYSDSDALVWFRFTDLFVFQQLLGLGNYSFTIHYTAWRFRTLHPETHQSCCLKYVISSALFTCLLNFHVKLQEYVETAHRTLPAWYEISGLEALVFLLLIYLVLIYLLFREVSDRNMSRQLSVVKDKYRPLDFLTTDIKSLGRNRSSSISRHSFAIVSTKTEINDEKDQQEWPAPSWHKL